jgi:hypothetical protein
VPRAPKPPSTSPAAANEQVEIEAVLRRLEELRRAAGNSELRRAYETAIRSLDAVVYRLMMLRTPGPAATRAAASCPTAAPKNSAAASRAAATRTGAARKPGRR